MRLTPHPLCCVLILIRLHKVKLSFWESAPCAFSIPAWSTRWAPRQGPRRASPGSLPSRVAISNRRFGLRHLSRARGIRCE